MIVSVVVGILIAWFILANLPQIIMAIGGLLKWGVVFGVIAFVVWSSKQ